MGNFVQIKTQGVKNYVAITEKPFGKVLALEKKINLHRFIFNKQYKISEIFYDTTTNLLSKAGVILSKTIMPGKTYFKVERQSFLLKSFSRKKETVFIHEVGARDKINDHAFFLVDGIKSLFTTQFTIDLENVLKNLVPKIIIDSVIDDWTVMSGGGFKGKILYKTSNIRNLETKRKADYKTMRVELDCGETYLSSFNYLIDQIKKNCKDFIECDESLYDYCIRVTKPLPPKKKLSKEEKQKLKEKNKKIEDTIQG